MSRCRPGVAIVLFLVAGGQSPARAEEPVLLKYKFAKGDAVHYKKIDETRQSQSLMNMKFETTIRQETVISRTADAIGPEGNATFKLKAVQRKVTAELPMGNKFEFDSKSSERDTSSQLGAELTPLYERLTGSEYQVIVNPRGKVQEVKGYAELLADLIQDKPLASRFGGDNKTVALNEQDSFVVLSDKPVSPGDKWESPIDVELPNIGHMKGKTTCTYEGPDKVGDRKTARIGVVSEITFDLKIDLGGVKASGAMSTTNSTGTIQFDPQMGRIVSSKRELALSGQFSADVNGMTITVDTEQNQTVTEELLDKAP